MEIDAMRHVMHDMVGIERRYYVSGGFIGSWHRKLYVVYGRYPVFDKPQFMSFFASFINFSATRT